MKLYIILIVLVAAGCSAQNTHSPDISNIKVLERGYDGERASKLCSMFDLTTPQASEYFNRSTKISENEAHHQIDYYSCWVYGTFYKGTTACEWQIDVGGLADITCGNQEYKLFCKDCDDFMLNQIP